MKTKGKKRKLTIMKKPFINEELASFIPPISRMGGRNPVDWQWGLKASELRPERIAKKV